MVACYFARWTIGLLLTVTGFSIIFDDLGFVNSFFGALIANSIIYIFPSLMIITPIRRSISNGFKRSLSRARCDDTYIIEVAKTILTMLGI